MEYTKRINGPLCRPSTYLLTAALMMALSFRMAGAATLVNPWADFLTMPAGTRSMHDLTAFTDPADGDVKLVIALGWEQGAPILFWDPLTQLLTTAFTAPLNSYPVEPFWRSLTTFNGKLYAGLGTQEDSPPPGPSGTGQVWQYDGAAWTLVLNTTLDNTYTLGVYNNQLYAGVGTFGSQAGQLWVSPDGVTWTMLKQFSSSFVRALAVFQNQLYIGLRDKADLWKYDGTTFTDIGAPPGLNDQVKTLLPSPDGSLLYVGGVPAFIYTWNGATYTLSLDARASDSEIYKGTVLGGDVLFPTHAKANGGQSGNIYRLDNGTWTLDYSTSPGLAQLQIICPFQHYLYAGGDGLPPILLQALYNSGPQIAVKPANVITFPNTAIGSTSTAILVVKNTGTGQLTGIVNNPPAPFGLSGSGSFQLASNAQTTITLTFTPTSTKLSSKMATIVSNSAQHSTLILTQQATGTAAP